VLQTGSLIRLFEHATQRLTIHKAGMDSKSDDAAGVVIHHD
jgi:hypothetical protein